MVTQLRNGLVELLFRVVEIFDGSLPGCLARIRNRRPVQLGRQIDDHLTGKPPARHVLPCSHVQDNFPNAMARGYGFGSGLSSGYTFQKLADRWPMPGVAFAGSLQLVEDSLDFVHGGNVSWRSLAASHVF